MVDMFLIVPDCPHIYGISVATLVMMLIAWRSCSTALSTESVNTSFNALAHCLATSYSYLMFIMMLEGFTPLRYQLRQSKRAGNCKGILKLTKKQWDTMHTCITSLFM